MSSSKAIREKRAPVAKQMKDLADKIATENRDFTAEEKKSWDGLDAEYRSLSARIDIAERGETVDGEQTASVDDKQPEERTVKLGRPNVTKQPRVEVVREEPEFRTPKEFLLAVMDAGMGVGYDKRLEKRTLGSDEAKGISDPAGGFLIPATFIPNLLKIDAESDPMGALTQKIPMATPIVKIPARSDKTHTSSVSGGLTVTRRPETVAGTSSQMTMEMVTLNANTLFGLAYATEEILTDSPISFAAILSAGFSDQFTYHLINERLNGTGVGEYQGIMNSPALVSVAKESGQAGSTIVWENVVKMRSRCWGYGKAIWMANHDCLPQLMFMNQTVGLGGIPVWQPSNGPFPDMLLGRPLVFTEYTKTLGTTGDIVLANWSEYLEGVYQPLQNQESVHVRFVQHERTFKFWVRNAGAGWWRVAITPKNSTATLSPFVVLDTRA